MYSTAWRLRLLLLVAVRCATVPSLLSSQSAAVVEGIITDERTGSAVAGAVVTLSGRSTISQPDGFYRIADLPDGEHTLTVRALGYAVHEQSLSIADIGRIDVQLRPDVIRLDPVEARLRRVTIRGTVRDSIQNIGLVNADVRTSLGHEIRTDSHGRFRLRAVYEGLPLTLLIRVFGYLPLEETFTPEAEATTNSHSPRIRLLHAG